LFAAIAKQKGLMPRAMDWKALRILIVRKSDGKEVFITSDKRILSDGRAFDIDRVIIDVIIDEMKRQADRIK
jgi:hypothetical protein